MEERAQTSLARALGLLERGPQGEEVAKDQRVLVFEPFQRLREVLLERVGDAIGESARVLDQHTPLLHELLQHAHGSALRAQRSELLGMSQHQLKSELRVAGVVLGSADMERLADTSPKSWD